MIALLLRTLTFGLLFTVLTLGSTRLVARVAPGHIGVRTSKWGGGISAEDFDTGFHLALPMIHEWTMLDAGTHVVSFTRDVRVPEDRPSLEIRTKDNNSVKIDVTVTYRIRRGEAHRVVASGLAVDYRPRARSTVEDILRAELGALTSEDWFSTERRLQELERIAPIVDAAFAQFHLELGDILIHSASFPANFEQKLQEKQISYQMSLLFQAQRGVEDAEAEVGMISAQTQSEEKKYVAEANRLLEEVRTENLLEVTRILAGASQADRETRAQADAEYARLVSEGQLEVERAQADAEATRLAALGGDGGRIWLAARAAEKLKLDTVELDASDPRVPLLLDVGELAQLLIGKEDDQ